MKLDLRVAHHHPGRLRLRSDAFAGQRGKDGLERVREALEKLSGVRDVSANGRTGSVLVAYDPEGVGPDTLVAAAADAANLPIVDKRPDANEERLIDVAIDAARDLNTFVGELTHHRA